MQTKKILLSLLIITFCFFSCEKPDIESNEELQKFWKLEGFYNNDQLFIPEFDPDTLFHFEVNIIFLWNDYTKVYEIQGQAPIDIYWGELYLAGSNIKFKSLETTGLTSDVKEVVEYEKKFFKALRDISSYKIIKNKLIVKYENDSQEMHFVLKERQYVDEDKYCTAKIDGYDWSGEKDYVSAHVDYDYMSQKFYFGFGGCNYRTIHTDGYSYDIAISANFLPQRGEFAFNNKGIEMNAIGGIMGHCSGRKNDQVFDTRSVNGVFGITLLNRSFVEGYFYFDSKGFYGDNIGLKRKVTDGKFLIPLSSHPNWFSPYKFDN